MTESGGTMSEEQVLPEFGMPCRESQIAVLQGKLAQSEAERERLQGELAGVRDTANFWLDAHARERERNQDLRQVVKEIRGEHDRLSAYDRCACWSCTRIDALLKPQPAPVATGEGQ